MKALKWLVIAIILIAVAAGAYLLLPKKPGTPPGASLLPADTFLFVQIPDPPRAREEFKTTALYKIWSEKEVQEFFGKSADALRQGYREKVGDHPYMQLAQRALDLAGGEVFLAVPSIADMRRQVPGMILGVDVKERKADADQWITEVKAELSKAGTKTSDEPQTHEGVAYTKWTNGKTTICYTYFGTLLVVTSTEEAMQATIDQQRNSDQPSLAADARFEKARKKMPAAHAALVHCNSKPIVALLRGLSLAMPQLQGNLRDLESVQSVSYSTTLTNGSFQDVVFVDAPAEKRGPMGAESLPVERKTQLLTSESTLFYSAQSMDLGKSWEKIYSQLANSPVPKLGEALFALEQFNRNHGWNFPKDFLDTVGPEYAIALTWEEGVPFPDLMIALQVKDKAKTSAALDKLWGLGKSMSQQTGLGGFVDAEHDGYTIHSFTTPWVSPNYTVTDQFFLLTLQTQNTERLLTKLKNGGKSLADSPTYRETMAALPSGGSWYTYLDTRNLFTRTYNTAVPLLRENAALARGLSTVDLNKLPQTQTIAQYLRPSAATQVVDKDGFTTVIISPVGMPAMTLGAMLSAGVAVAQNFPHFPMK